MFQRKPDKLFQGLLNIFGTADDVLIVGFDDMGGDKVLKICRQASIKLNKGKYLFWCTSIQSLGM